MEKTELMEQYEARTGLRSTRVVGDHWCNEEAHTEGYVDDLEERFTQAQAKAEAYDRLVSKTIMSDAELDAPLAQRILREMAEKAEAYDRLMSGGKKTLKEWANILGMNVVVNAEGMGMACDNPFIFNKFDGARKHGIWLRTHGSLVCIPAHLIDYTGSYTTSLTLPDGWEVSNGKD